MIRKPILLTFLAIVFMLSCSEEQEKINLVQSIDESLLFEQSVLMGPLTGVNGNSSKGDASPLTIELKNYNSEFTLNAAYNFNGMTYNDDGLYLDEIAGDGVYTSLKEGIIVSTESSKSETLDGWKISKKFQYNDILESSKLTIKCDFHHDACPSGGGFWDSDWGTGWGCFYFENCSIEAEF